jgi:hypothetical protein
VLSSSTGLGRDSIGDSTPIPFRAMPAMMHKPQCSVVAKACSEQWQALTSNLTPNRSFIDEDPVGYDPERAMQEVGTVQGWAAPIVAITPHIQSRILVPYDTAW